jgi:hypothetical protein
MGVPRLFVASLNAIPRWASSLAKRTTPTLVPSSPSSSHATAYQGPETDTSSHAGNQADCTE